ncbi:MAG: SEC-C domain-containing protein, partial [Acidobacteria bacterium]|nr:SEC-C domain-containing protein [Acidobacteriota bacterium]
PCPCGSGKKYKKCHGACSRFAIRVWRNTDSHDQGRRPSAFFAG